MHYNKGAARLELGAALLEFIQEDNDFIGTKIFPVFKSQEKKANFPAITRETLTQVAKTERAPNGSYNRGSMGAKDKLFNCVEHGFEMPLDDSFRALFEKDFDAELAVTKGAGMILLRNQEQRIADKLFNTTTFSGSALYTNASSTAPWATETSNIIKTVRAAKAAVRKNCGLKPNALIMSETNLERALGNKDIVGRLSGALAATDVVVRQKLAEIFDVRFVFVAKSVKNTSAEGKDFSGADIWSSDYVMVAVVAEDGQDLTQPSVGRTFLWVKDCPENVSIEQYRDDPIRSDVFRARSFTDEYLIDPNFAHLVKVA